MTAADQRDREAKEHRGDNPSVIANHFAMLPQVVCECWYGEVMKQSRSQLAMKGADWRDRVAREARDDGCGLEFSHSYSPALQFPFKE